MKKTHIITKDGSDQSKDRNHVINICCYIETLVGDLLKNSLGYQIDENPTSFGNTSQSLSFNAKINLILDFKAIDKTDRLCFVKLQEIRNQFAHNYFIKKLTDLNSNDNGSEAIKYLEKKFKEKIDNYTQTNDNLKLLFDFLIDEIEFAINKIRGLMEENLENTSDLYFDAFYSKNLMSLLSKEGYLESVHPSARFVMGKIHKDCLDITKNNFRSEHEEISKKVKIL